jgi:hypothetical protein
LIIQNLHRHLRTPPLPLRNANGGLSRFVTLSLFLTLGVSHFCCLFSFPAAQGRNNLFYTMALFVYYINKYNKGRLASVCVSASSRCSLELTRFGSGLT